MDPHRAAATADAAKQAALAAGLLRPIALAADAALDSLAQQHGSAAADSDRWGCLSKQDKGWAVQIAAANVAGGCLPRAARV